MLLDTSGVLAWADAADPDHERVAALLRNRHSRLVTSAFVVAEVDYMLRRELGPDAQSLMLREIERGSIEVAPFTSDDIAVARRVIEQYASLGLSLADASLVVLSHRLDEPTVLTLDERDFRVLPGPGGEPLRLLPADA